MASAYNPHEIEKKWQDVWEKDQTYRAEDLPASQKAEKFFGLIEFPYPSGEGLHVGHPRSYTAIDIMTRKKRMEGKDVLYPIGWDAFGLPTENFAIKHKIKPADATKKNVGNFTRQLKSLGFGFDWSREVNTTDPKYFKWTQWMFLKFYSSFYDEKADRARPIEELEIPAEVTAKGKDAVTAFVDGQRMAFKTSATINWCPSCKIGLANEEAQGGVCERCGGGVEKREKAQWMIRITKYANRLVNDLSTVDYLEKIKAQQINWIGRSEGTYVDFAIVGAHGDAPSGRSELPDVVTVFTTRPDTLFGATYLVLAPEHPLVETWVKEGDISNADEVRGYQEGTKLKSDLQRQENKEKTGVELKGIKAKNPATGEMIPVWIADYVIGGYGTGAIMAVPAHDERDFEFAKRFGLPAVGVVKPDQNVWRTSHFEKGRQMSEIEAPEQEAERQKEIDKEYGAFVSAVRNGEICWTGYGFAMNSSNWLDGLHTLDAKEKMMQWLEAEKHGQRTTTYKLRDWVFSRQRYWGEPIPIVFCEKCGVVPVPDAQLPVVLPEVEAYQPTDTGESPLAAISEWVNVSCPTCGGPAKRETDTMPNWAGSSWYFLRYCDPHNDEMFADPEKLKFWMPVDLYNGGMEHTTLHLLYSRFWHKFFWDLGFIPKECGSEPYAKRRSHALILGEGGVKMSKSKGNVVNPDDVVAQYGADVFRMYEMFIGPFDADAPWDTNGIEGVKRFLEKVWRISENVDPTDDGPQPSGVLETALNRAIKKVTEDIESMNFNTAISAMMILVNETRTFLDDGTDGAIKGISRKSFESFLKILAPFAPHLADELWHKLGHTESIHRRGAGWPTYDPTKLQAATFELVVQVNGKLRDKMTVSSDISEEEATKKALSSEKIQSYLEGKTPQKVVYVKGRLVSISV